jgi:hypothetical protein
MIRPIYNPPYDSPIEDRFAENLVKYLRDDVDLSTQVECKTICGDFHLDFLITSGNGAKVAIECDGKEFHDSYRDE